MKKRLLVAAIAIITAGTAAFWYYRAHQPKDLNLVLYANVDIREVDLAFRQPGRVQTMLFDEGDTVKQGDKMATLDDAPYRDALTSAQANVKEAEATLQKLRSGNRNQEIRRAKAAITQAEASFNRAEADFKRQSELFTDGVASKKNLEAATSARDEAAAVLQGAKESWSLLQEGSRTEDILMAEAALAAKQATASQVAIALADTILLAPKDGVIQARVREPGSMVGNRDTVYTLSLPTPVYVRAYVGQPDLPKVAPGTPVIIEVDGVDSPYKGQIGYVSPRAEFTPKSVETTELRTDLVYRLRIVVTNPDKQLRQGMPVTVRVLHREENT